MKKTTILLWIAVIAFVAAGCAGQPAPNPDGPRLVGFESLPKALATVVLSPTPGATEIEATLISIRPTATVGVPTLTPTYTPYYGKFMGNMTPESGTVVYRGESYRPPPIPPAGGISQPVAPFSLGTPSSGGAIGQATLAPVTGPTIPCAIQPAAAFANAAANPTIRARIGCPTADGQSIQVVGQVFQKGYMFWRDTREIYVLSTALVQAQGAQSDTFWRVPDAWTEGMPASDAAFSPPEGLAQPVRGFGLVWRSNQPIRDTIGWALGGESVLQVNFQPYERGWMMTGFDGKAFAIAPNDNNPTTTGIHFGPF